MSTTLVQFRATPGVRDWLKDAAHAERMTLSRWLRQMALRRAAELVPPPPSRVVEMRDEEHARQSDAEWARAYFG